MTRTARLLLLAALTAAVLVGGVLPASAGWSATSGVATSIATETVAAPGSVTGRLTCGNPNSTMNVTWTASPSSRVSGYRVTVHYSDGYEQSETLGAAARSWTKSTSTYNVTAYSIQYSVTTLTDYGWTKQSYKTGSAKC